MSASLKGKPKPSLLGRKRPEAAKKIAAAWTDEMREAARARGKANAAKQEWILRIAESLSGDKNPRWLGGVSQQQYAPGFSKSLKQRIRERDDFRCQLCAKTEGDLGYNLTIHHVDYDKANHDPENLASVCKACNSRVNTNRDVWLSYFVVIAEVRSKLGKDVGNLIGGKVITQREGRISIQHVNGGDVGPDISGLFADI